MNLRSFIGAMMYFRPNLSKYYTSHVLKSLGLSDFNPENASKKSSENSVCICRLLQIFAYIILQS